MSSEAITAADVGTMPAEILDGRTPAQKAARYICRGQRAAKVDVDAYKASLGEELAVIQKRLKDGYYPDRSKDDYAAKAKSLEATIAGPVVLRVNCRYDLTDLVHSKPFDGLDHWIACPQCGCDIKVTNELR